MSDKSRIEWCDATINPAYGCWPVSPACDNCYASRMAGRLGKLTEGTHKDGKWTGRINLYPERMAQVLAWKRPRRIFVGSMTDLFHERVPDEFLDKVFAYMAMARQHTFMLLTKRPKRMREYAKTLGKHMERDGPSLAATDMGLAGGWFYELGQRGWHLPNVWFGVTAEDQQRANERIPILLDTPAAKRFVSVEPTVGPVRLNQIMVPEKANRHDGHWSLGWDALSGFRATSPYSGTENNPRLDWVICGGESGPNARPMHPDWVRSLRDQCATADVPFLFKQWGEWGTARIDLRDGKPAWDVFHSFDHYCCKARTRMVKGDKLICPDGHVPTSGCREGKTFPMAITTRLGKRKTGRLLDGVEHNQFPGDKPC